MPTFVAQRISQKNNVLFPDKITIEGLKVTYYKGEIIGYKSSVIYMESIASVSINENILLKMISIIVRLVDLAKLGRLHDLIHDQFMLLLQSLYSYRRLSRIYRPRFPGKPFWSEFLKMTFCRILNTIIIKQRMDIHWLCKTNLSMFKLLSGVLSR